jgi:hypothetical protein
MATIYNSEIVKNASNALGIQLSREKPLNESAEKIIAVVELNPLLVSSPNVHKSSTATTGTIYTVPSDGDFYLTIATMSIITTAAGVNGLRMSITLAETNESLVLLDLKSSNSAVVDTNSPVISQIFNPPLKLKKGSTVILTSTGTVSTARTTILGYQNSSNA